MTSPAHGRSPASDTHDDETPTQFDSSFAEDAAQSLRAEHWTSELKAADTSMDSALARFEQASLAFAVVARAARAGAPDRPVRVGKSATPAVDADGPVSTTAPVLPVAPVVAAAEAIEREAPAAPAHAGSAGAAEAPVATRAEPGRLVSLKPTPQAGRLLAPTDMIRRAFEDTTPDVAPDDDAPGAASARAGRRLALWSTIGVAALVAGGALALAARPSQKSASAGSDVAAGASTPSPIAPTPMTVPLQVPVSELPPVEAAASAPGGSEAPVAPEPSTVAAAVPTPHAAQRTATAVPVARPPQIDVDAAIATAQSTSDRFLSGGAGSTSRAGADVKADAAR